MKYFLVLFFIVISLSLEAQSLKQRADNEYNERNYASAISSYQTYIKETGVVSSSVSRNLANCYFYTENYSEAQKYFEKVSPKEMTAQDWLNYGDLLRRLGMFSQAMAKYNRALHCPYKDVSEARISIAVKSCEKAMKKETNASSLDSLELMEQFKRKRYVGVAEFSPGGKRVYYTKEVKVHGKKIYRIYSARLNITGAQWEDEKLLSFCDGTYNYAHPALSQDGKTMYFASDMPGTLGGMDIFKVEKKGNGWGTPVNLGSVVNTDGTDMFPYVTPGGYLSFSSNGHPGYGGMDAFWVEMQNGKAVSIKHADQSINTSLDDFSALINPDKMEEEEEDATALMLAQQARQDSIEQVRLAEKMKADSIAKAKLLAARQQAKQDSIENVMLAARQKAYQDSLRLVAYQDSIKEAELLAAQIAEDEAKAKEEQDEVKEWKAREYEHLGVVNTFLVDALSSQLLKNAKFVVVDNVTKEELIVGNADNAGKISLDLKSAGIVGGQAVTITAMVNYGSFSSYTIEMLSNKVMAYDGTHPIPLVPIMAKRDKLKHNIVANKEVVGGNAFVFNDSELTEKGKEYLDAWANFLIMNPDVKIKMMAHTDTRGEVSYNFKLSQRRAFEAKSYLISEGVSHLQVVARGYGERYPLVKCKECTEREHNANRRIEIEVINTQN